MTSSWRIFDFVHIAPPCHCNLTEMRFDFAVCDCCCFLGIKSRCIDFNLSFFSCTTNNFNANLRLHEISNYHESLSPRHNLTPQSALPGSCHVPLCQVISTHRYKNEIWEITSVRSKNTQKKQQRAKTIYTRGAQRWFINYNKCRMRSHNSYFRDAGRADSVRHLLATKIEHGDGNPGGIKSMNTKPSTGLLDTIRQCVGKTHVIVRVCLAPAVFE